MGHVLDEILHPKMSLLRHHLPNKPSNSFSFDKKSVAMYKFGYEFRSLGTNNVVDTAHVYWVFNEICRIFVSLFNKPNGYNSTNTSFSHF